MVMLMVILVTMIMFVLMAVFGWLNYVISEISEWLGNKFKGKSKPNTITPYPHVSAYATVTYPHNNLHYLSQH